MNGGKKIKRKVCKVSFWNVLLRGCLIKIKKKGSEQDIMFLSRHR